jgi:DNA polymerase-3 subunit alpha
MTFNMYTHLNTHSYYSFLDGVLSPDQLVQCAVEQGMRSLCLTDFNNLTGAVEFYDSCHKEGIKPLLGLELKIHHTIGNGNLVLIGSNNKSWGNLCRLSSLVMCREKKDPSQGINLLQLAELSEGLICLCGGKRGLITNLLASKQNSNSQMFLCQLRDIFKDQLYISLQIQHPSDQEIVRQLVVMSQQCLLPDN